MGGGVGVWEGELGCGCGRGVRVWGGVGVGAMECEWCVDGIGYRRRWSVRCCVCGVSVGLGMV